mgnify:CR=1 FL=1
MLPARAGMTRACLLALRQSIRIPLTRGWARLALDKRSPSGFICVQGEQDWWDGVGYVCR